MEHPDHGLEAAIKKKDKRYVLGTDVNDVQDVQVHEKQKLAILTHSSVASNSGGTVPLVCSAPGVVSQQLPD